VVEEELKSLLEPGETIVESRRLHGSQLILPVFFLVVGSLQFTPWAFAPGTALPGVVAISYGLFIGSLFYMLYQHGRVALTDHRLVYLQKTPFTALSLTGWDRSGFDAVMVRHGVMGKFLNYGHLLLLKSGRLVTVIRSVTDVKTLVPRIEKELLKKG
jgi:hypothetical protein